MKGFNFEKNLNHQSHAVDSTIGVFQDIPLVQPTEADKNYINPAFDFTEIQFNSKNEYLRISLFDAIGSEIKVIYNGKISEGNHTFKIDTNQLTAGNYFVRIASNYAQKTKSFMKS